MVLPSVGTVVILPFPFSDLSGSKLRPALILADAGRGDWILCQITSKSYADPLAIELAHGFSEGGLRLSSYARPGKLFTANSTVFLRQTGILNSETFQKVLDSVVSLLRSTPTNTRE